MGHKRGGDYANPAQKIGALGQISCISDGSGGVPGAGLQPPGVAIEKVGKCAVVTYRIMAACC